MTNFKSTKRALITSVVALFLCIAMLVGTTYAWFTDEVTSDSNIIKTGTLDIVLEKWDGTAWVDASDTAIFEYTNWEPGYTQVVHLRVVNKGSLALKWEAAIDINGRLSELADMIDIYVKSDDRADTVRGAIDAINARPSDAPDAYAEPNFHKFTLSYFINNLRTMTKGVMEPNQESYLSLVLQMNPVAGNKYQNMDLGGTFDFTIFATQYTSESDSFDSTYDKDATFSDDVGGWDGTYPTEKPDTLVIDQANGVVYINDEYAFAYLHTLQNDPAFRDKYDNPLCKNIVLNTDLNMGNKAWKPLVLTNFVSFDGQGHTISNLYVNTTETGAGLFGRVGNGKNGKTELRNFTVNNANIIGNDGVAVVLGMQDAQPINNVHVTNAKVIGNTNVGAIVGRSYGAISNCSVKDSGIYGGKRVGAISGFANSNPQHTLVFENNHVENVVISGERVGSLIGQSAAGSATGITIKNNTVKNVTVTATIDAATYPAGEFIGNNTAANGGKTILENVTSENCQLVNK